MPPPAASRPSRPRYDAVVVGAGPNGLAAAVALAQAGRSVLVVEAQPTVGGGTRTQELTLPGFRHDVCSAIHPLGMASPFLKTLPLARHGLEWIQPPIAVAHPFDDGTATHLEPSFEATGATLGEDAAAYRRLLEPLARQADALFAGALGPMLRVPRHPFLMARFGLRAVWPAQTLANRWFQGRNARALFAGNAAHAVVPLDQWLTSAVGLMLMAAGHAVGWPLPRGGSQAIADALAGHLRELGGEVVTGWRVDALADLPPARAVLCDLAPKELLRLAGDRLTGSYAGRLRRYRYGPAAFKIDYALAGPIPWKAAACGRAGTVHLGGTLAEIAEAEKANFAGHLHPRPFVLVAQQSLFDPTRAPAGQHTAWAYCHVPNGCTTDFTGRIEAQIERFAPGFRDLVLARHVTTPADFERYNPNYVGGDIAAGVADLAQLIGRPVVSLDPYATSVKGLYLCSASTPPGPGVHGLCGYWAARSALRTVLR